MVLTRQPTRSARYRLRVGVLFSAWLPFMMLWASPCSAGSRSAPHSPPESVRFDIQDQKVTGVLPIGQTLTLSVRLSGRSVSERDVVAIFESPGFPMRLVPLSPDPSRAALSALVTFEPLPMDSSSPPPKALRIDVTFATTPGMHLHRFQRRTLYLTLGTPALPGPPQSGQGSAIVPRPDRGITGDMVRANTKPIEEGKILEEDLLAAPPVVRGNSYWEDMDSRIRRSWTQRLTHQGRVQAHKSPTVHFRIYPNGEAQLVQVERSSGDFWVDLAALESVVEAHPFPPFPSDLSDPHLDVHVELLLPTR